MLRVVSYYHDDEGNCIYFKADEDGGQVARLDHFDSNGMTTVYEGTPSGAADIYMQEGEQFVQGRQKDKFDEWASEANYHASEPVAPEPEPEVEPEPVVPDPEPTPPEDGFTPLS